MEHTLTYSSYMAVCFLLTMVLHICNMRFWRESYRDTLEWIYFFVMLSSLSDAIWIWIDGNPDLIPLNYFLNAIEFSSFGYAGFCWFMYTVDNVPFTVGPRRMVRAIALLPILAVSGLIIASFFTGWLFTVDAGGNYCRGPFFFIQQTGYLYIWGAALMTIHGFRKARYTSQRRHLGAMLLFAVPPTILGGLQLLFPPGVLPLLQVSILISLILSFSDEKERRITQDSLTKLLNRYELERILDEKMMRTRKIGAVPLYVLVGDLDQFKEINDNFGHLKGDEALRLVGKILDAEAQKYNAAAGRLSGDEFCMVLNAVSDETVEKLIRSIGESMKHASEMMNCDLSISIGFSRYSGRGTLLGLIDQADRNMYEAKNLKKTAELSKPV